MTEELKDDKKKKGLQDGDVIEHNGEKVRVELLKTKVKNKAHPREHLYQGRTGYDYNKAMTALLSRLTEEQMEQLAENQLVMDEQKTSEWMSSVKTGDVIGVRSQRYQVVDSGGLDPFPCLSVNKVAPVQRETGVFRQIDPSEPVEFLSLAVLDHARELELLDILWRDGALHGTDNERDMTVVLLHPLTEPSSVTEEKPKKKKKK